MRTILFLLFYMLLNGCSSTRLIKHWRNPDYIDFKPKNVLVIGVNPNMELRKSFERELQKNLNERKINALQSTMVFDELFQNANLTESELESQIEKLAANKFDAILISAVIGSNEYVSYASKSPKADYQFKKSLGYYLLLRDTFYQEKFYESYEVYEIQTLLYRVSINANRVLVWSANYELIDPKNTEKTINNYIHTILISLEKEGFVSKK